ncbi:MAG: AraC family transcriptional regulator [Chitinophagaceae bacterium]
MPGTKEQANTITLEERKSPEESEDSSILHYEKMKAVEKILIEHISGKLPGVTQIAKATALSESSLKRHFKLMYAAGLYEYFLELKMKFAKIKLVEKKLPVKEVAYMIGYEKTSCFIRMFKKHYQSSPGVLPNRSKKES